MVCLMIVDAAVKLEDVSIIYLIDVIVHHVS